MTQKKRQSPYLSYMGLVCVAVMVLGRVLGAKSTPLCTQAGLPGLLGVDGHGVSEPVRSAGLLT